MNHQSPVIPPYDPSFMGIISAFLIILTLLLAVVAFLPGEGQADLLDEDPDFDGYDGAFSRPGEEFYTTAEEYENFTNPRDPDSDDDRMSDGWEVRWGFNPNDASDADLDSDGDGVSNVDEYFADTNPRDVDLDHDGMPDIWEDLNGLNSSDPNDRDQDPDGDGLTNYEEFLNLTTPRDEDTDDDGMWDGWEVENSLNPRNPNDGTPDSDHGGVSNLGEFHNDTDPWDPVDDYGNAGGGNGGSGIPTGDGVPPDTGRTDTQATMINVFEPPLGAFKRWQVLNGLGSNYLLFLKDNTTTSLPVAGGDFDHIFYGALNVTLEEGVYLRIPSPTPDSVLLGYFFEDTPVEFFKDPADNYYILAGYDTDPNTTAIYSNTLYFTYGTDGNYFSLDIPQGLTTADEPVELLPDISAHIRGSVGWFIANAGDEGINNLDGETSLDLIVSNLTSYFSNFTSGNGDVPDPADGLDIYQTIAINMIGACRHRAFAFFVTANTLGVPTRYVANEVHCFVEVYIPDGGAYSDSNWHRINLGGAGETDPGEPRPEPPEGSMETIIQLGEIPADLFMGESFVIDGNISTLNGTPLAYFPFIVLAGDMQVASGSSDSMGDISMDITLSEPALGPGMLRLIVDPYNGYLSNSSENRSYTLYSAILLHSSLADQDAVHAGQGTTIFVEGYLSSMNGTELPSESITLRWNGSLVDVDVTTDQGEYNLSHTIGETHIPGTYIILISYAGHDYFLDSNFSIEITITGTNENEVWMNTTVTPSSQDASALVYVTGTITDGIGGSVEDRGNLVVLLHGMELVNRSLSDLTDAGGKDFNTSVLIPATLSRGDYILHVRFLPNGDEDKLGSAFMNLDLYVDKITTYIYLHPGIIEIGEMYTINGTLYSGSGILVQGEIELFWDGDYLTTVDADANGNFQYQSITRRDPGPLPVGAEFNGSEMFTPSSSNVNYSVFSNTHFIFSEDPEIGMVTRNQTITIDGNLLDDNSANVLNVTIFLYALDSVGHEDLIQEVVPDASGFQVQYDLSADYVPGPLTLELLFREEGYYRGTSSLLEYTVFAYTFFSVEQVTNPVQAGRNLTLNGTFFDDMVHNLDLPIHISFLEKDHIPGLNDGNISWEFPIPLTQESGDFPMVLTFDGMNDYEAAQHHIEITIFHLTNITAFPNNLTRGETGNFNGVIRDELGNGIPDLLVDIFLRDEYLTSAITESDGTYGVSVTLDSDLELGPALIEVFFNSTDYYWTSNESYVVDIYAETMVFLEGMAYTTRDAIHLDGRLTDNLGVPLANMSIAITFNSEIINLTTDGNGNFSHKYREDITLGFYTFSALFGGDGFYHPTNGATNIHVVSPLTIELTYRNEAVAGRGFIITGTVVDDHGDPVNVELNATLSSDQDIFWKFPAAINGLFNTTWTLQPGRIPGDYILYLNNTNPYPNTHYLPSTKSTSVFMTRATYINLIIVDAIRGEDVTIKGNVSDVAGNPIKFSDVRIIIDGMVFHRETDHTGNFTLQFIMPEDTEPGPHDVTATYDGNLTLEPFSQIGIILVYVPTEVIMNSARVHWSLVNLTGKVVDNLGNEVEGTVYLYFNGARIGAVSTDQTGFDASYRYHTIGRFEARAEFKPYSFSYNLESEGRTDFTLFAYYVINSNVNSTITDIMPKEFELENPVLAGEWFNLTLNVTSDLNLQPTIINLMVEFEDPDNTVVITTPNSMTLFNVSDFLIPQEVHNLTIRDLVNDPYFELYPDPAVIHIDVVQPTAITADQTQVGGILTIDGRVIDGRVKPRNVADGELNVTLGEQVLNFSFEAGDFSYRNDVSDRWGPENYTIVYPTNKYYLGSWVNYTVHIKAFTNLTLNVPHSLAYGEEFKGSVKLTLMDGTAVIDAVVGLEMIQEEMTEQYTVITSDDGTRSFHAIMDSNGTVTITAVFGGNEFFYGSTDVQKIEFDANEDTGLKIGDFFSGRAVFLYLILGGIGFYIWRRKQINYLMSLMHDTALRLDAGENPRSVVIIAYNLMGRHLRRFSMIRHHHQTVGEFKGSTQRKMRLSEDGIGDLTRMMEYSDYSKATTSEGQKERAVSSLRQVERELAGLGRGGRRG
jgi:hypothetical protein